MLHAAHYYSRSSTQGWAIIFRDLLAPSENPLVIQTSRNGYLYCQMLQPQVIGAWVPAMHIPAQGGIVASVRHVDEEYTFLFLFVAPHVRDVGVRPTGAGSCSAAAGGVGPAAGSSTAPLPGAAVAAGRGGWSGGPGMTDRAAKLWMAFCARCAKGGMGHSDLRRSCTVIGGNTSNTSFGKCSRIQLVVHRTFRIP